MRMAIAVATILAALAVAASAAEPLGPETLLPVRQAEDAYTPGAAFGADTFLVVWQSGRLAAGDLRKGIPYSARIVGCRVDRAGNAADAEPFVISGARDLRERPFVAFGPSAGSGQGGGVFLVVWQDLRNERDWDVYAARVTPAGKVLDPDGLLVSGGPHNQANPRVTFDGKTFLVVWQDFRSGKHYEAFGARVSADGKVLDPRGVVLGSGEFFNCLTPAAASAGGGVSLVEWVGDCENVAAYMLPAAATVVVADGRVVADKGDRRKFAREGGPGRTSNSVALAAGPDGYLSAWTTDASPGHGRGNVPAKFNATLIDPAGKLGGDLLLSGSEETHGGQWRQAIRIRNPDLAWDGSAYLAAWHTLEGGGQRECPHEVVRAARVGPAGQPAGDVLTVAGSEKTPAREAAVASDGAAVSLIAYEKHPETPETPIRIGVRILDAK